MKAHTVALLGCAACLGTGAAMHYASGDGHAASRLIEPADPFERICVSGGATIRISQGTPGEEARINVSADDDVIERVAVEVSDGALFVAIDDDISAEDVAIDLTMPTLSEFVSSGAVKLTSVGLSTNELVVEDRGAGVYRFADLAADELLIEARGASWFHIDGEVERQIVDIAGTGAYEAAALQSATSEISLKGAGHANVRVSELLTVHIAGAGMVQYAGDPEVQQRILGAGRVRKLNDS